MVLQGVHLMNVLRKRASSLAVLLVVLLTASLSAARLCSAEPGDAGGDAESPAEVWQGIRSQHFGVRDIQPGDGVVELEVPPRAEDPAFTPVHIRLPGQALGGPRQLSRVLLFIDMNPEPLALELRGGHGGLPEAIATRVRVERYTDIRAVAEASDGSLYMATAFVKSAGGCSASPQSVAGDGRTGEMRFSIPMGEREQVQISVRHPNHSGLQRDPWTHDWIPPNYIKSLAVSHAGQLVFHVRTGISLSENPTLRFSLPGNVDAARLLVEAMDSSGELYQQEWRSSPGGQE
jgi:sulfur-oxidizing protein SoxY